MDGGSGDHQTAHQGCVWLFVVGQSPVAAGLQPIGCTAAVAAVAARGAIECHAFFTFLGGFRSVGDRVLSPPTRPWKVAWRRNTVYNAHWWRVE